MLNEEEEEEEDILLSNHNKYQTSKYTITFILFFLN